MEVILEAQVVDNDKTRIKFSTGKVNIVKDETSPYSRLEINDWVIPIEDISVLIIDGTIFLNEDLINIKEV